MTPEAPLLIGRKPVREALADLDAPVEKVLIQRGVESKAVNAVRQAAAVRKIPVQFVPVHKLNRMAGGGRHQGFVAVLAQGAYEELEVMLHRIAANTDVVRAEKPRLLILDQIEDPYNFGAILRSAVAFGVRGVIVPTRRMAPLSATAVKASAGTALRIPIARVTNLHETLLQLKERGYWIAGAAGEGETSAWDMDWNRPLALVMGSEGTGLREHVRTTCDYLVSIPISGPAESLNVSVATGIFLALACKV